MKRNKDKPLEVRIEKDQLIIRIGVDTLAWAFEHSDYCNPLTEIEKDGEKDYDFVKQFSVLDKLEFAKDVIRALCEEEEDGSTPLNTLLDKMCEEAVEQGSEGIDYTSTENDSD